MRWLPFFPHTMGPSPSSLLASPLRPSGLPPSPPTPLNVLALAAAPCREPRRSELGEGDGGQSYVPPRRPPASAPVTIACDAAYPLCDANDKRASHTRLASAIRRRIRGNAGALTRSRALFPRLSGAIPAAHRRRWCLPVGAPPDLILAGVRAGQGVAKRENTARWGARSRLSSWVVDRRAAHAPAESTRWTEVRTFAASSRARFEVLGTRADSRAPQSRAGRLVADATSAQSPAQYGEARSY